MKRMELLLVGLLFCLPVSGQQEEQTETEEGGMERLMEQESDPSDNDALDQERNWYRLHPLDLNRATADELAGPGVLNSYQISSLLTYRRLLGPFISRYELQAVPGFDPALIRRLLLFARIGSGADSIFHRDALWRKGTHQWLMRAGISWRPNREQAEDYAGGPWKIFTRYSYRYANRLQYGFAFEKDAGETLFGGSRHFFDFSSFHFFIKPQKILKQLALGDFTINLGQGLIQWQGLSFGSAGSVLGINKEGALLRPYSSSGEFNFHRGLALLGGRGRWSWLAFGSHRFFSARLEEDSLQSGRWWVSALQPSGYHRTAGELAGRNQLQAMMGGTSLRYEMPSGHIAVNSMHYRFSEEFRKDPREPYNLFSFRGDRLANYSIDFAVNRGGMHWFGEGAMDYRGRTAWVAGFYLVPDSRVDICFLFRKLDPAYSSFFSQAFSVSSTPANEQGWYAGMSIRPARGWKLDLSADQCNFPWLRYRVDAPSRAFGWEGRIQYTESHRLDLYLRYRYKSRPLNASGEPVDPLSEVAWQAQHNIRFEIRQVFSRPMNVQVRSEWIHYCRAAGTVAEQGFLWLIQGNYRSSRSWKASARIQYFETASYASRLYAFESDVLYSYSIPAFYGRGMRAYLNLSANPGRRWLSGTGRSGKLRVWLKLARSLPLGSAGSEGPGQTEIKGQVDWQW